MLEVVINTGESVRQGDEVGLSVLIESSLWALVMASVLKHKCSACVPCAFTVDSQLPRKSAQYRLHETLWILIFAGKGCLLPEPSSVTSFQITACVLPCDCCSSIPESLG